MSSGKQAGRSIAGRREASRHFFAAGFRPKRFLTKVAAELLAILGALDLLKNYSSQLEKLEEAIKATNLGLLKVALAYLVARSLSECIILALRAHLERRRTAPVPKVAKRKIRRNRHP